MTVRAFRNALRGIAETMRTQQNARFHAVATLVVLIAGFWFGLSRAEWALVMLCITLVLALEALNTALEHLTDLVSPHYHPLAGKAKDAAAGAVLLGAIGAATAGLCIFGPKIAAALSGLVF